MPNKKLESDRKLINTLLDFDPMDWSRRENGDLVVLNAAGQKFVYTDADLKAKIDKKLAEKAEYHPKPGPKSKGKALTEEQAPYDVG